MQNQLFNKYYSRYAKRYHLDYLIGSSDKDSTESSQSSESSESSDKDSTESSEASPSSESTQSTKEKLMAKASAAKAVAEDVGTIAKQKTKQLEKSIFGTGKCIRYVNNDMNEADSNTYQPKSRFTGRKKKKSIPKGTKNRRSDGKSYQTVKSDSQNCGALQTCYLSLAPGAYGDGRSWIPVNTLTQKEMDRFRQEGQLTEDSSIQFDPDTESRKSIDPQWAEQKGDNWYRIQGDCMRNLPKDINIYSQFKGGYHNNKDHHTENMHLLNEVFTRLI